MSKTNWVKIQEFQDENKDLFIVVASPQDDGMSISFGGLNSFVKFPGKDMTEGVVFNMLRKSKFKDAVHPFMAGLVSGSGIITGMEPGEKVDPGSTVLDVVGGSIQAIAETREITKTNITKNGKTKK